MSPDSERAASAAEGADWYGPGWSRRLFFGLIVATLAAVALSVTGIPDPLPVAGSVEPTVPVGTYLFGFLGATVYAFTSFAKRFDESGRYRLKVISRTVAALPLAAGVYLIAFAFTGFDGGAGAAEGAANGAQAVSGDRVVAGLVFLAGLYVNTALQALGGVADRLLGVDRGGSAGSGGTGREGGGGDDPIDSDDASGATSSDGDGDRDAAGESGDNGGSGGNGDSTDDGESRDDEAPGDDEADAG